MVQSTDLTLSNQSGANYRAEHNSINSALGSTHKGPTAPAYAIAGLPWVDDTSTPWVFKIYDGTDWIKIGDIDPAANTFTPANAVSLGTDNTFTGKFAFADKGELTIATGAITITAAFHTVDTEADAASDDLDTINGGSEGEVLIIRPANDARTVVIKHGTGNIATASGFDITLSSTDQAAVFIYDAEKTEWLVVSAPDDYADQPEAEAGVNNTKGMTPLRTQEHLEANGFFLDSAGSFSAASDVDFVGLGADTHNVKVFVDNITVATDETALGVQMSTDSSSPTFVTSSSYTSGMFIFNNIGTLHVGGTDTECMVSGASQGNGIGNAPGETAQLKFELNKQVAGLEPLLNAHIVNHNGAGNATDVRSVSSATDSGLVSGKVDSLRLTVRAGTTISGEYQIWKRKH